DVGLLVVRAHPGVLLRQSTLVDPARGLLRRYDLEVGRDGFEDLGQIARQAELVAAQPAVRMSLEDGDGLPLERPRTERSERRRRARAYRPAVDRRRARCQRGDQEDEARDAQLRALEERCRPLSEPPGHSPTRRASPPPASRPPCP